MRMSALQTILVLNISSRLHTSANRLAGFAQFISAEFFVIYSEDLDMNIDAVKDGASGIWIPYPYTGFIPARQIQLWL